MAENRVRVVTITTTIEVPEEDSYDYESYLRLVDDVYGFPKSMPEIDQVAQAMVDDILRRDGSCSAFGYMRDQRFDVVEGTVESNA